MSLQGAYGPQNPTNPYANAAQYQMPQQPAQGANQQSIPNAGVSRPAPGYNTAAYGAQQGSAPAQNQAQVGNYSNVNQYGMTGYEDMTAYGGKQEKQDAYGSQVIDLFVLWTVPPVP